MTFIHYSDYFEPDSTAVEAAYYNAGRQDLAVVLDGGSTYVYRRVPLWTWNRFKTALSAGRFYATDIKPNYGPGDYIGYNADEEFVEGYPASDMGPVTYVGAAVATTPRAEVGKGTPKGLTYAPYAQVFSPQTFALTSEPTPAKSKFTVHFTVEDGNEVKTHTVETVDIDSAVAAIATVSDMLDVNVDVKGVYVHFEE